MSRAGTVDWTSRPLINGTRQAATAMRNPGHPNQHVHASVECTRRAALGAEPPHSRFAEVEFCTQIGALTHPDFWFPTRSGRPQNASTRPAASPVSGKPAEQAPSIFKSV